MATGVLHMANQFGDLLPVGTVDRVKNDDVILMYFRMMMMHSFQQFAQQIPVLTSANLLAMLAEESQATAFDPLAEIRNGCSFLERVLHGRKRCVSSSPAAGVHVASIPCRNRGFHSYPRTEVGRRLPQH